MKHLKKGRKFSRQKKQREALIRIMLGNLLEKRKITTTLAKAKELKMIAEKIIGSAKKMDALKAIRPKVPKSIDAKTIRDIAKKTASRNSGYMRIIKKGPRRSDGAPMAVIEIIEDEEISEPKKS